MFSDRVDAGRRLGELVKTRLFGSVVVVGLPRGGVPVAFEVARAIGAPLDVIVVRKLGVPSQPEVAMGAIGEGGVRVVDQEVVTAARVSDAVFAEVEQMERSELARRVALFRRVRPRLSLYKETVIVVDDGIATGSTARAACQVAAAGGASHVIVATPVAPRSVVDELSDVAEEVICLEMPAEFVAVGRWYSDFRQTRDEEVLEILRRSVEVSSSRGGESTGQETE